jgi:hypothetical protein
MKKNFWKYLPAHDYEKAADNVGSLIFCGILVRMRREDNKG